jgi:regulator of replication initiation timing
VAPVTAIGPENEVVPLPVTTRADRGQIEELKNEVKARAEVATALEKENKELKEKLEKADWSDKMDLLHEWALDYDHALKVNQEREQWYGKYNGLFSRMINLKYALDNLLN